MPLRYPHIVRRKGGSRASPEGRKLWCGPFAVALLAGLDYDTAYLACQKDAKRVAKAKALAAADEEGYSVADPVAVPDITWTYPHQVDRVLRSLGARPSEIQESKGTIKEWPTLLRFVREHTVPGKCYLIHLASHWLVVMDGFVYHGLHDPMPVEDIPHYKKAKVEMWYEVKPRPEALG